MCTIGFIKTSNGFLLFKNRDRLNNEPKENYMKKDDILGFYDKSLKGVWAGFNKFGIGIVTSYGPVVKVTDGLADNFEVTEEVLRKAKTIQEARDLYLKIARDRKLNRSFNVVIADKNKAIAIELRGEDFSVEEFPEFVVKANYFSKMTKYDEDNERCNRSQSRIEIITNIVPEIKTGKDLIPVLKHHSENDYGNVCMHCYIETGASVIFEFVDGKLKIFYQFNDFACKNDFKEEDISFS